MLYSCSQLSSQQGLFKVPQSGKKLFLPLSVPLAPTSFCSQPHIPFPLFPCLLLPLSQSDQGEASEQVLSPPARLHREPELAQDSSGHVPFPHACSGASRKHWGGPDGEEEPACCCSCPWLNLTGTGQKQLWSPLTWINRDNEQGRWRWGMPWRARLQQEYLLPLGT